MELTLLMLNANAPGRNVQIDRIRGKPSNKIRHLMLFEQVISIISSPEFPAAMPVE